MIDWVMLPLKRYSDFEGRSGRQEFWMFVLGLFIVEVVIMVLSAVLTGITGSSAIGMLFSLILILFCLAILVPSIALAFRRMHDQDKSAWFLLLAFVPFVGGLILLVFYCLPGTVGPNKFGPDPKDPNAIPGGGVAAL